MFDLVIKSKRVITPTAIREAQVCMKGSVIEAILPYNAIAEGPLNDVGNKLVMPGVIDPHVHINEPGRTDWEGFDTATKSAAAGGITTLVDMPLNASPVTTTVGAFEKKLHAAKKQLHVNCGFWGGIVPGNSHEIEPLIEKGVLGFKAFLTHSGIDEFPNATEDDLRKAMPLIATHKLPLLVHCELTADLPAINKQRPASYADYLASRPRQWEDKAIQLMIDLCEEFGCRVHIVHLSSSNAIQQIAAAKQKGLPITAETAQHYLYFSAEDIKDGRTEFKCAPPIREKENNELLWQALKDGTIDFVATDHSPAPPEMKQMDTGNFRSGWGGISSLQFALPVLWTAAQKHDGTVTDICKWLCEKPATFLEKEKSKGKMMPGYDADIIVWDEKKSFLVTASIIQHKHKITPYLGEELLGVVEQTFVGGMKVYDNGSFTKLHKGKLMLG